MLTLIKPIATDYNMHPAATFRVAEKAEALAFIAAHPFATFG